MHRCFSFFCASVVITRAETGMRGSREDSRKQDRVCVEDRIREDRGRGKEVGDRELNDKLRKGGWEIGRDRLQGRRGVFRLVS